MNQKLGLRTVLYARFSSDLQRSESIDAQIRAMKSYCEKNHMQIVNTYVDEAKTATSDKRPAFQKMIDDSNSRSFDVVLVHKLDRFSRNRYDSAMYKRTLKLNGVRVYSVLENLDDSPESIMLESLLEGMSEYYSKNLAREVLKGMKENALQCKHTGGIPPLGYYVNQDKKLSVDEKEAETVRLIFDRYANGYTYGEIITELNQKNMFTKRGCNFGKNSLYSILTNEKYTGVYVYNKTSSKDVFNRRNSHKHKDDDMIIKVPNGCPQIISTDVYQAVQSRMAENRHLAGMYNTQHKYLLSGFVICGYCGRRMTGNRRYCGRNKSLYVSYRCLTHADQCISKEINRYYLEDYVLLKIKECFGYKNQVAKMYHKIGRYLHKISKALEDEILALSSQLNDVEMAISNLAEAVEKGVSLDDILTRSEQLEEQKRQLEKEILNKNNIRNVAFTDDDIEETVRQCKALIKCPTHPTNRVFLKKAIKNIVVKRDGVTITLNTGLSVNDDFDTVIFATRDDIYSYGRSVKNAG